MKRGGWKIDGDALRDQLDDIADAQLVSVSSLLPADSPRQAGEDIDHVRMLSATDAELPPIIVHRPTMRVIDGMHRLAAASSRGDEHIRVRFFHGTERDAFVLAVEANVTHGLPLSLADRMKAAQRLVTSHPTWSDRAIAAAAGLSAKTVGNLRRRSGGEAGGGASRVRTGRDGRLRPLDHVDGRLRASEAIKSHPDASLREIARISGVSPSTARDVRQRIQRGEDAVPSAPASAQRQAAATAAARNDTSAVRSDMALILQGLQNDPSLRLTESGRSLLRWISSRAVRPGEFNALADNVPAHSAYLMADMARLCAEEWQLIVMAMEKRTRHDDA